jgi:hypothetical protein
MDQSHVRSKKRALGQKRRELTIDPDFSAKFSTEELNPVLLAVKSGKNAGNSLIILAKEPKNGSSLFLTIF